MALMAITSSLDAAWKRHVIDNTSQGADGVRLADVNQDGLMDIATGWEEGGLVRVYLHPGREKVKQPWPFATVGKVNSPEDAVFADIDGNGIADVISSCEGATRSVFVHWAPNDSNQFLDSSQWKTEAIPSLAGKSMWMFCKPAFIDDNPSLDLILGSKGANASIGWLEAPVNPRKLDDWKWHSIYEAGWIMSIMTFDADQDGDLDILISDRKGPNSGIVLLENGIRQSTPHGTSQWIEHRIGPQGKELLFLDFTQDSNGLGMTVWVAVKPNIIWQLKAKGPFEKQWDLTTFEMPHWMSRSKAVRQGDIDLDGYPDLVVNCEGASDGKSGMAWFSLPYQETRSEPNIIFHDVAGPDGIKFDRIELLDLDGDGDLDIMTCEERDNLGVIWYENPVKP